MPSSHPASNAYDMWHSDWKRAWDRWTQQPAIRLMASAVLCRAAPWTPPLRRSRAAARMALAFLARVGGKHVAHGKNRERLQQFALLTRASVGLQFAACQTRCPHAAHSALLPCAACRAGFPPLAGRIMSANCCPFALTEVDAEMLRS